MNDHYRANTMEPAAEAYLVSLGMTPLLQNFRTPYGEIDLILRDGDCIVFVEVKRRRSFRQGSPMEAVTLAKRRKIILSAQFYRMKHPETFALGVRFDVVALSPEGISYVRAAFDGAI